MLPFYHFALLLLNAVKLVFARRAASLERKFARLAKEVATLLREPVLKEGNSNKQDPFQFAKRQYVLGALVQKKDRLEAKHYTWAQRTERLARLSAYLLSWKGRLVPYALGVADVLAALYLLDYLTDGNAVNLRQLFALVGTAFNA